MPKVENEFWKRAKGQVMFIAGKKSLLVSEGWRDQRMQVLHRRQGGSTYRANIVVYLTKKETDI